MCDTNKTTKITCPKCDGSKNLNWCSHVENGVCFGCNGTGTIEVDLDAKRRELSDHSRTCAEWIMASTADSYKNLSWSMLNKARDFAHSNRGGVQEAFPEMLNHFREVGDPVFFARQEDRLAEWVDQA